MAMEQIHIWVGNFASERRLKAFTQERYDDDGNCVSEFGTSQGENFFDHDWVECQFGSDLAVQDLATGLSYSRSYLDLLVTATTARDLGGLNTIIIADAAEFAKPGPAKTSDYTLEYLGVFPGA